VTAHQSRTAPWLFISPFIVAFLVFYVYPVGAGFLRSLTDQIGFGNSEFVGLGNYVRVLRDPRFWRSIRNVALLFTFGSMMSIVVAALLLAHIINNKTIAAIRRPFTTVLFAPNVTSVIVVGIVFSFLLKTNNGAINEVLAVFGIEPIQWLRDPRWAIPSLVILVTWRYVGVNTLYVLAGMQSIPETLYESARLEGANPFQVFFRITLPLLKPMMEFIVFQALIGTFAIFGEPYVLVDGTGGTRDSMLFPTFYLYETSIRGMRFGYASALAFTLAAIILIVTFFQRRAFRIGGDNEA
jgi:ABC-type sugar transport system permease subunit